MVFLAVLAVSVVFAFACRRPLKACPWVFYAMAAGLDVLFIVDSAMPLPGVLGDALFLLLHKCTLATALFVVVMYIGVFARDSRVATALRPVRAELSILAWLLSLGHMAVYLSSYALQMSSGVLKPNIVMALAVAAVLFCLLLVLGVTSFNAVKRRMRAESWKHVQLLAYPFFGLVYVHLMLMLLPSALQGGAAAQVSVAVYSAVFVLYAVLRIARAVADRHGTAAGACDDAP